jgi:hypothetical protein
MIPEEICHYTKKDIALEYILYTKELRLGQMKFTNDPRESKPWRIPIMWEASDDTVNTIQHEKYWNKAYKKVNEIIAEEWKVLCATIHNVGSTKNPLAEHLDNRLSPGYSRPQMWAQYAENHSGVCLIFDGKKLNQNIIRNLGKRCKIFSGQVEYHDFTSVGPRPILHLDIEKLGPVKASQKYVLNHYQHLFLRKYPVWEHETEYRWLVYSSRRSPEYVSIEGAIKFVLIGSNFPKVYEPSLRALCKELKIPAGRMIWNNGLPYADIGGIYNP